jgi:hypothetical protein
MSSKRAQALLAGPGEDPVATCDDPAMSPGQAGRPTQTMGCADLNAAASRVLAEKDAAAPSPDDRVVS